MRKFFILSSQRSGTTWFCEKLAGMFGRWCVSEETDIRWWEELSSATFIDRKNLGRHHLPVPNYLSRDLYERRILLNLESFVTSDYKHIIRKTPKFYNDVYNSLNDNEFINVMYEQCNINEILNYPVIHFIRRDTIAQASSSMCAQETKIWHNNKHYSEEIEKLGDRRNIELKYDLVIFEAERVNISKTAYHDVLSKYHKNCLTVYYEDCLDENYWKTTLNDKLENFFQDSIRKPEYETTHQITRNLYNITNSDGTNWPGPGTRVATRACEHNKLPKNADSLSKIFKFPINKFKPY